MSVFILLKKKREHDTSLPYFEVHSSSPALGDRDKLLVLEDGYCADTSNFEFSNDLSYVIVHQYRISNIGGFAHQELLKTYTLPRVGR